MKGTIAVDMDGTLTAEQWTIPERVLEFFRNLVGEGWQLLVVTGRPYTSARKPAMELNCPFILSAQNGSVALEQPEEKVLDPAYLDWDVLEKMDELCHEGPSDYVVYGGYENEDQGFYRSERFSKEMLEYI